MVRTNDRLDRIEARLDSLSTHVSALVKRDLERDMEHAALENRVTRIERRLDLVEGDT